MATHDIPVLAMVTFPAPPARDPATLRELLDSAGQAYTSIPGLRRKYFLNGDGEAGGAYEWENRARAEAFYDADWFATMTETYGARPQVRFFDSPAIADGINHRLEMYLPDNP
jgi:hypothetical protein